MSPTDALKTRKIPKGYKRVFKFRYVDFAELLGMTPIAVRKAVLRKKLDPSSLRSVFEFYAQRLEAERARRAGVKATREHVRGSVQTLRSVVGILEGVGLNLDRYAALGKARESSPPDPPDLGGGSSSNQGSTVVEIADPLIELMK